MSKVFVDTNVVLDLLASRQPFEMESRMLFSMADLGQIEIVISSLSIVNTHYILNDVTKTEDARTIIGKFKVLVDTHALTDKIIELALNDYNFADFEDGIQYYTALESQCELIITRNPKDFKKSAIPVFTPKEYVIQLSSQSKS